jgi:GMP synthase (glutamine-hydrolysing)
MNEIKDTLGTEKGISACSGGVDATTATYLVHRAVGENLILTKG